MKEDLPPLFRKRPGESLEDRALDAILPKSVDAREEVSRGKKQQWRTWILLAAALLLLLSIFSSGFFLFAVLVMLGLWAVASVWARTSLDGLEVRRILSRTECEVGEVVDGKLTLANRKEWPAWWLFWREQAGGGVDIEGTERAFLTLGAKAQETFEYRLHSYRRGLFRIGPAMVEAGGPFGLLRRYWVDAEAKFLTVMPRVIAIGQSWPLGHRPVHEVPRRHSLFEDPSRFLGIREYRRGDSQRRIHWRATARSDKLQVKLFEPSVLEGVTLAVEMSAAAYPKAAASLDATEPRLELAITTAASLVEFVLAGDQRVGLLANGADAAERFPEDWKEGHFRQLDDMLDDAESRRKVTGFHPIEIPAAKGAWQRDRLRAALARLVVAPGPSLAEVLHVELPRLSRSLVLAILTPTLDDVLAGTIAALRASGIEVAVVWIGQGEVKACLPSSVPVYAVAQEKDIEQLGSQRL